MGTFFSNNERTTKLVENSVVYEIRCSDCDAVYANRTNDRSLDNRLKNIRNRYFIKIEKGVFAKIA